MILDTDELERSLDGVYSLLRLESEEMELKAALHKTTTQIHYLKKNLEVFTSLEGIKHLILRAVKILHDFQPYYYRGVQKIYKTEYDEESQKYGMDIDDFFCIIDDLEYIRSRDQEETDLRGTYGAQNYIIPDPIYKTYYINKGTWITAFRQLKSEGDLL